MEETAVGVAPVVETSLQRLTTFNSLEQVRRQRVMAISVASARQVSSRIGTVDSLPSTVINYLLLQVQVVM